MGFLGFFEEFFSESVYPHRWPVGIVLAILIAAGIYLAWRLGWHRALLDHKRLTAVIAAPALVVMSLGGYYTLSPLWQRSTLCEDNPLTLTVDESQFEGDDCDQPAGVAIVESTSTPATPPRPTSADATGTPVIATPTGDDAAFEPRVVSEGTWQGADEFHFAEGKALLLETEPGNFVVRVEEFSVRNGPDLFVYLSPDAGGFADGALNLGTLKATDGAFNYAVPEGAEISQFKSVVVWCKQFAVLFGTAPLN